MRFQFLLCYLNTVCSLWLSMTSKAYAKTCHLSLKRAFLLLFTKLFLSLWAAQPSRCSHIAEADKCLVWMLSLVLWLLNNENMIQLVQEAKVWNKYIGTFFFLVLLYMTFKKKIHECYQAYFPIPMIPPFWVTEEGHTYKPRLGNLVT